MTIDRRHFLSNAGAGLLSAAILERVAAADPTVKLPPIDAPSEKPKQPESLPEPYDKRLGIAIVGIGRLTVEQLLPAFAQSKKTKLAGLVSGDRKKAELVADQMSVDRKHIYDYTSFDRIKDDPAIDAVYIVLPNHMHADYTIRAAAAGKHVLCEKPMATTPAECEAMIAACKKADRKLMIAYRIQYEPHNRFVMKAVREKRFGAVRMIEGHNGQNEGDPKQWRLSKKAGGGCLVDVGIYCLNTCRFVLGEEPIWVSANVHSTTTDPRFREVDENVAFQLGFPSGVIGSFSCSFSTHVSRRYRCLADHGGWIDVDPAFSYDGLAVHISEVRGKDEFVEKPQIAEKQQFALELDHFATCVRTNKQPYTPGEEGLQDVRIMEAIFQSAREGKRIELPRITKLDAFRGTPPAE